MPSEPYCRHLLIVEDDTGQHGFSLEQRFYTIGRDHHCDIRLVSQFVSRCHAQLRWVGEHQGGYYRIVDGDPDGNPSANGILINGRKRTAWDLQHEDVITFGPGIKATYLLLKRDAALTIPPDEFDITLISPGMVGQPEPPDPQLQDWLDARANTTVSLAQSSLLSTSRRWHSVER